MSKFIPFTEEELYRAAHSDIKTILENFGEAVEKSGSEYLWKKHDSVKFRGHIFYQHSTGNKGTAVNFLMEFFGYSFQDAVIYLLDGKYIATRKTQAKDLMYNQPDEKKHKPQPVILPPKAPTNNRLFAYLCKTRGISHSIVYQFLQLGLIYEEALHHNIVFIGKDRKGIVRYAGLKGTISNKPYRGELPNSNKLYSFKYVNSKSNVVYVFEAFIDLMSYINLYINNNWQDYNYLTLNGLSEQPLTKFLKDYPNIKIINVCTDNDFQAKKNYGQIFAEKISKKYSNSFTVNIITPHKKDWNEDLLCMK